MPEYDLPQILNAAQINIPIPPDISQSIQKLLDVSRISPLASLAREFPDMREKFIQASAALSGASLGLENALAAQMEILRSKSAILTVRDMDKIVSINAQLSTALKHMTPLLEHPDLLELQKALKKMTSWFGANPKSGPFPPEVQAPTPLIEDERFAHDIEVAVENVLPLIPELKKQLAIDGYAIENVAMMMVVLVFTAVPPDELATWLQSIWDAFWMCVKDLGNSPTVQAAANLLTCLLPLCACLQAALKKKPKKRQD